MKPSHCIRLVFVLVCLALAGCVETRFESPLGDHIETCDARWKGLWTGADSDLDLGHDVTAFHVNEDCEFSVLHQPEAGGALKRIRVPLNYVHVDNRDYIVVADTALAGLVKLKPPHGIEPAPPKSFFFARYQVRGTVVMADGEARRPATSMSLSAQGMAALAARRSANHGEG